MPPVSRTELRTRRLLLRSWRADDLAAFADVNADPRVRRWYPTQLDRAASNVSVAEFAAHHDRHGFTFWALEVVDSVRGCASFVGMVGLLRPSFHAPFPHADPLVEVGWRLHPHWWGLGLATEAAIACLEFAFDTLGLDEVVAFTVPPNLPSQAVMQRIGMRYDGVFQHPTAAPGAWWGPHVLYRASPGDRNRSSRQP